MRIFSWVEGNPSLLKHASVYLFVSHNIVRSRNEVGVAAVIAFIKSLLPTHFLQCCISLKCLRNLSHPESPHFSCSILKISVAQNSECIGRFSESMLERSGCSINL